MSRWKFLSAKEVEGVARILHHFHREQRINADSAQQNPSPDSHVSSPYHCIWDWDCFVKVKVLRLSFNNYMKNGQCFVRVSGGIAKTVSLQFLLYACLFLRNVKRKLKYCPTGKYSCVTHSKFTSILPGFILCMALHETALYEVFKGLFLSMKSTNKSSLYLSEKRKRESDIKTR